MNFSLRAGMARIFVSQDEKKIYVIAVGVRVLILVLILWFFGNVRLTELADGPKYMRLATTLLARHAFVDPMVAGDLPEDVRPPGYPAFLAFFLLFKTPLWAISLVQILVTSLCAVYAMRLARRMALSPRVAYAAGIITALEPLQALHSVILSSDAFGSLTFLLFFYFLVLFWQEEKLRHLMYAVVFLAAFNYVRRVGVYLGFAMGPLLVMAAFILRRRWRNMLVPATLFIVSFFLLLMPWMARNYYASGHFAFSSSLSRVLFYNAGGAVAAARDGTTFEQAKTKLENEIVPRLPEPRDIESFKNGPLYRDYARRIILANPVQYLKLYFFALNTFFTSGNYHYLLKYFGVIDAPREGVRSFTLLFASHSLGDSWAAVRIFVAQSYGLIALLGRIFWIPLFLGSLLSCLYLWRVYPASRFALMTYLVIVVYSAAMIGAHIEGTEARHRMYLDPLMFVFGSAGLSVCFAKCMQHLRIFLRA